MCGVKSDKRLNETMCINYFSIRIYRINLCNVEVPGQTATPDNPGYSGRIYAKVTDGKVAPAVAASSFSTAECLQASLEFPLKYSECNNP